MNLILLGMPASGKGTQSQLLINKQKFAHISMGDIVRDNINNQTKSGLQAKKYLQEGKLVPDSLIISMIEVYLETHKYKNIIWDGFPRNIAQNTMLNDILAKRNQKVDHIIYLKVKKSLIYKRILGRKICPKCQYTYNTIFNPPKKANICDVEGSKLIFRKDDNLKMIKVRIKEYNAKTKPLVKYYQKQNLLTSINSNQDSKIVFQEICRLLK